MFFLNTSILISILMRNPEKKKPLLVDKDGVGRISIPKGWVEMLEWRKGDKIEIVCDLKSESITIRKKS